MSNVENGTAVHPIPSRRLWNRLGTIFEDQVSPREAMKRAGMDFNVEAKPIFTEDRVKIPDRKALVRSDDGSFLGLCGKKYEIVQNSALCDFVETLLGPAPAIEAAGLVGKGERLWLLIRLPEEMEILPGDPVSPYLLVSSSHDSSHAIQVGFTPIRVTCRNLLVAGLSRAEQRVAVRHTKNAKLALKVAGVVLDKGRNYFARAREFFQGLAASKMSEEEIAGFVERLFPGHAQEDRLVVSPQAERARGEITRLLHGEGLIGFDSTAPVTRWTAWNATTQWVDNTVPVRGRTNRLENSLLDLGSGSRIRSKAVELLSASLS